MIIIYNDDAITEQATAEISEQYDEIKNAVKSFDNKKQYNKIYCVASLGLWSGRKRCTGCAASLEKAMFYLFEDQNKVFFKNKNSTLTLEAIHHDGANIFKFYKVVNGKKCAIKYNDIYRG